MLRLLSPLFVVTLVCAGPTAPVPIENTHTPVLVNDGNTVSCSLSEGETNFVIALPTAPKADHVTFVNENAVAAGDLSIAVANDRLPVQSPKWMRVEGTITFAHKRAFDLSLLGVQAKFVRLTFRVHKEATALGLDRRPNDLAAR